MVLPELSLHGVFTPIVTSFDAGGRVAHDRMAANLDRWNRTDLRGYIVLGSNGEWVFLDEAERLDVLRAARQSIPRGKLMIAGCFGLLRACADHLPHAADEILAALKGTNHPRAPWEFAE